MGAQEDECGQLPALGQNEQFRVPLSSLCGKAKTDKKRQLNQGKPLTLFELQAYSTYSNLQQVMGDDTSEEFKKKIKNLQITFQNGNVKRVQNYKYRHQQTQTYLTLIAYRASAESGSYFAEKPPLSSGNGANGHASNGTSNNAGPANAKSEESPQKAKKKSVYGQRAEEGEACKARSYADTQPSCNNISSSNHNNSNSNNSSSNNNHTNNNHTNNSSTINACSQPHKQGNLLSNIFSYEKGSGKQFCTPSRLQNTLNHSIKIHAIKPKQQQKVNSNTSFEQTNSKLNISISNSSYNPNQSQMKAMNINTVQIAKKSMSLMNKQEQSLPQNMMWQNDSISRRYQQTKSQLQEKKKAQSLFDTQQNFNASHNCSNKQDITQLYLYNLDKLQSTDNNFTLQRRYNDRNRSILFDDQKILEQLIQIPKQELSFDLQQLQNVSQQAPQHQIKNSLPVNVRPQAQPTGLHYQPQQNSFQCQQPQMQVSSFQPPVQQSVF